MHIPVVVVGAGPQGLAAGAHLLERGIESVILEAGAGAGASVAQWGHVRLFSPWPEVIDPAAERLLTAAGWQRPGDGYPTGAEWVDGYLSPLAAALGDRVRYGARVVGVARKGRDVSVDAGRSAQPFVVHLRYADGREDLLEAQAVIDASGTWTNPAPAGANGLPALGEAAARESGLVTRRIPNAIDAQRLADGHAVVVGAGHSAATAVIQLADAAREQPGLRVTWVLRRGEVGNTFGGGDADELAERGALGMRAKQAVTDGVVDLVTGFRTERIRSIHGRAVLAADDGRELAPADRVFVLTGFRPDLSFLGEVRLGVDMRLQAPVRVADEVDPNVHSCGSVRATGAAELAHPEQDFFVVGAKSYGRAPTFLAMTGFEQVRSVVAALAGDHAAAARVELELPETGVCGGSGVFDVPDRTGSDSCCAPAPQLVQLGTDHTA